MMMVHRTFAQISRPSSLWLPMLCLGVCLMLFGFVVLVKPELLAFFVAGIIIFLGAGLVTFALGVRSIEQHSNETERGVRFR